MTELLRLVVDLIERMAPIKKVRTWEHGCYYLAGRYQGTVGPGAWPLIPWLCDLIPVSMVPAIHCTPLQTITLRDKSVLTFAATVTVCVADAAKALNSVEQWSETTMELVTALLAERLADADPSRFDPARGKRDRLLDELREEADAETVHFGVRVQSIRFHTFAVGVRTLRLLTEPAALKTVGHA